MSTAGIAQALAAPTTDRASAQRAARQRGASETAFSAQIAAYYPYPRAGAEAAMRAPPAADARSNQVSPSATLGRRRQGRDG